MSTVENPTKGTKKQPINGSLERRGYLVALRELQAKIKQANDYNAQINLVNKKIGIDVGTIKELEEYLEKTTGFKNLEMAADSLNVKDVYLKVKELNSPPIEEQLIVVNKKGIIEQSPDAVPILQGRFTPEVHEKFQETARKFLEFQKWYETLTLQEKRSLVQFQGTQFKVKLDSLLYVHR